MSQPSAPSDVDSPVTGVSDIESSAAQDATALPAESTTSLSAEPVTEEAVEPVGEGQPSEAPSAVDAEALLVREGDVAADYLERLLDILDYDGDIDLDVESDRAVVAVVGGNLRGLIGAGGATLDSLQELTRLAVAQQTGVRTRLMLDVGGYRAQRRAELTELGRKAAEAVRDSGTQQKMAAMNPFERKVVHDAVATIDGVFSESEGEEPSRCVVILPRA